MVFDKLENASIYYGLGPRFRQALEWLQGVNPDELEAGAKIDLSGNVFATCFDLDTLPAQDSKLEAHRNYADIQCLLEGTERMGYALEGTMKAVSEYTPDIQFFQGNWDTLTLRPGNFYIVWPQDLHAPRVAAESVSRVKRLVIKVKLD